MRYTLHVAFKSNERPWSMNYDGAPPGPKDETEAREWANGMQRGLEDYTVTLLCDGKPVPPRRGD